MTQVLIDRATLEQLVDALENHDGNYKLSDKCADKVVAAITAGRAALANAEPVKPIAFDDKSRIDFARALIETQYVIPVVKPLESSEIVTMYAENPTCDADMIEFAREIEKAHGITKKDTL